MKINAFFWFRLGIPSVLSDDLSGRYGLEDSRNKKA